MTRIYCQQIMRSYKPLTKEQEFDLHKKMRIGLAAEQLIRDGKKETQKLRSDIKEGITARNTLIESVLPWIVKIAFKKYNRMISLDERIGICNERVCQKIHLFDPNKGKLITWIYYLCRTALYESIYFQRVIKVPRVDKGKHAFLYDIKKACNLKQVKDEMVSSEQDFTKLEKKELKKRIGNAIAKLPDHSYITIILARAEGRTLEDIGNELGVSKERVRQKFQIAQNILQTRLNNYMEIA